MSAFRFVIKQDFEAEYHANFGWPTKPTLDKPHLLFFMIALFCYPARGQHDCVLQKDADSIKVYTCASEQMKFKTIKATFEVNATLSRMAAFVMDIENYVHWQYNTIKAQTIKKTSVKELIYYTEIAAPWPVSNRDMVTYFSITQDTLTKLVTIDTHSFPGLMPVKEGLVRVPMSHGVWKIAWLTPSRVSVEYVIQIDPGGSVPAWMINMVAAQAPYDSFRNLRDKIHDFKIKKG